VATKGFFRTHDADGVRILPLEGEVDLADSSVLEFSIVVAMDGEARPLVIDLTGLRYCDSTVIAALIRQRNVYGKRLQIVLPPGAKMRRVFEMLALGTVLELNDDLPSAIGAARA
jgi:anti-anti-sigma factor